MLAFPHFQGKKPCRIHDFLGANYTEKYKLAASRCIPPSVGANPLQRSKRIMKDWGGPGMKDALAATDAQNGNKALHIAAQNGHLGEILRWNVAFCFGLLVEKIEPLQDKTHNALNQ